MAALVAGLAPAPAAATHRHSLAEYAYLIGTWNCVAHPTGRGTFKYSTSFIWKYANRSVIDQTIAGTHGPLANFMLTYDAKTDSFRGTYVDNRGDVGVWTDPGPVDGAWTEIGYSYRGNATLVPESRTHFFGVTDTHYAYEYWTISSIGDAGTLVDTEACEKVA